MSRRKKRPKTPPPEVAAEDVLPPQPPERWPPPKPRLWMLVISAVCVLAWLAVLAYIGLLYGN